MADEGKGSTNIFENREDLAGKLEEVLGILRQIEDEKRELEDRTRQLVEENREFAQRYIEVEEQNSNLASLYVASYQLHSTLVFNEVVKTVVEIIINLVGAEAFAILLLDEKAGEMRVVASEGFEPEHPFPVVKVGEGILGETAQGGEPYFDEAGPEAEDHDFLHPIACVPLKIKDRVLGLINVVKLLTQKKAFEAVDYELFNLLAAHAATAIFASRLYTQSERKLSTIQSFLEALSNPPGKSS